MSDAGGDPVPAISEAAATGEIAHIYEDIRRSLGVPVVNLIWRHLAYYPGVLKWCWSSIRPLYQSRLVFNEAIALRRGIEVPSCAEITKQDLLDAGLSFDARHQIEVILNSYERSNALNMIALSALLARLQGAGDPGFHPAPRQSPDPELGGSLPALVNLADMPARTAELVTRLNDYGGPDDILASMYRHLAHWPAYLRLIDDRIAPLQTSGVLGEAIHGIKFHALAQAHHIMSQLDPPNPPLPPVAKEAAETALRRFSDGPIVRMITIVAILQNAMPTQDE